MLLETGEKEKGKNTKTKLGHKDLKGTTSICKFQCT